MKKEFLSVFVISLMCLCSCGQTNFQGNIPTHGEIVGDLYHTEYWDQNDEWDLKNLQIKVYFENGEFTYIDAKNSNITYIFSPSSPNNLDHSVSSFKVIEGIYNDKKTEFKIDGREFNGISIVDFPYKNENDSLLNDYSKIIIISGILIISILIFILIKKKQKVR